MSSNLQGAVTRFSIQPRHREQQVDKDAILLSQDTGDPLDREEQDLKKGW